MIHFSFSIYNPFSRRNHESKTLFTKLIGYKLFDVEIERDNCILDIWFRYTVNQSHAGIIFSIGLLSYGVSVTLEDIRHWNKEINDWEKYDDDQGC